MHTLITRWFQTSSLRGVLLAFLLGASATASGQVAGVVEFARGVGSAQMPGQTPRTLGQGLPLNEGDRLTISENASAIIRLNDGTRMSLRPNSEILIEQFKFKPASPDNKMVTQLLRGGFKAVTGEISKSSSDAAQVRTANATIKIHGTDFDARICAQDCKAESSLVAERALPNTIAASAKLIAAQGQIEALDFSGKKRTLVNGGSVYPGDTVTTAATAKGVLVFRDESRVTLGASTSFKVESFVYDQKNPSEGSFLLSLARGSLRALTGVIGKSNTRNVGFKTPTATVGIRGTGLDLDCIAINDGANDSCSFYTWAGVIEVLPNGQTTPQILGVGQGLFVSRTEVRPLNVPTLEFMQRPDTLTVDMKQLFTLGNVSPDEQGLFVYVRDGHIEIITLDQILHLGLGETGFAGSDGRVGRPDDTPLFIQFDRVPMPNQANPMLFTVLAEVSKSTGNLCR